MRRAIADVTQALQILSRKQEELNRIVEDACEGLEDDEPDDPYGLFHATARKEPCSE